MTNVYNVDSSFYGESNNKQTSNKRIISHKTTSLAPPLQELRPPPIFDSGTGAHLMTREDADQMCDGTTPLPTKIPVMGVSDNDPSTCKVQANAKGKIKGVPGTGFIAEGLTQSLISTSQLDNEGCITIAGQGEMIVIKGTTTVEGIIDYALKEGQNDVIGRGKIDPATNLYHVTQLGEAICPNNATQSNRAFFNNVDLQGIADQVKYFAAAFGMASKEELVDAVKYNRLLGWPPHLTPERIQRNFPQSLAYDKGHLQRHAVHKRLQVEPPTTAPAPTASPLSDSVKVAKEGSVAAIPFWKDRNGRVYADSHGPNSVPGRNGATHYTLFVDSTTKYWFVVTHKGGVNIDSATDLAIDHWKENKRPFKHLRLDNQISMSLQHRLKRNTPEPITYDLAEADLHSVGNGPVEKGIQDLEKRLVSILANSPHVPASYWEYALQFAVDTHNIMHAGSHPGISSFNEFRLMPFDISKRGIAPWGTKALGLIDKNQRINLSSHGFLCTYIAIDFNHYKSFIVITENGDKLSRASILFQNELEITTPLSPPEIEKEAENESLRTLVKELRAELNRLTNQPNEAAILQDPQPPTPPPGEATWGEVFDQVGASSSSRGKGNRRGKKRAETAAKKAADEEAFEERNGESRSERKDRLHRQNVVAQELGKALGEQQRLERLHQIRQQQPPANPVMQQPAQIPTPQPSSETPTVTLQLEEEIARIEKGPEAASVEPNSTAAAAQADDTQPPPAIAPLTRVPETQSNPVLPNASLQRPQREKKQNSLLHFANHTEKAPPIIRGGARRNCGKSKKEKKEKKLSPGRALRKYRQRKRLYAKLANNAGQEEDELARSGMPAQVSDPKSLDEALARPDGAKWRIAWEKERDGFWGAGTATRVDRVPKGHKASYSRLIFRTSYDALGNIKYKVRICYGGNRQPANTYTETHAPVATAEGQNVLFAIAAAHNLEMGSLDVEQAFLQETLKEEIYMILPDDFGCGKNAVVRLNKSLYGLKQAALVFYEGLKDHLLDFGFKQTVSDPCIFIKTSRDAKRAQPTLPRVARPDIVGDVIQDEDNEDPKYSYWPNDYILIVSTHVDDLKILSDTLDTQTAFFEHMAIKYGVKTKSDCDQFVGVQVERDRAKLSITLSQKVYAESLIEQFLDSGATITPTPSVYTPPKFGNSQAVAPADDSPALRCRTAVADFRPP